MDATNNDIAPEEVRNPIAALKRFARRPPPQERCELCALPLAREHRHLVEPATRKLLCTCDACSLLFSGRTDGKYRQVPRRIEAWPNFHLEDYQWEALGIPIDLAFFYFSTPAEQVVAVYPSPAGATESLIVAEAWQTLIADNPKLASFEPDVEALLVNRVAGAAQLTIALQSTSVISWSASSKRTGAVCMAARKSGNKSRLFLPISSGERSR